MAQKKRASKEESFPYSGTTQDRTEETSGQKKLWNYLYGLSDDVAFLKRVALLRKKYKIPENGCEVTYGKNDDGTVFVRMPDFLGSSGLWGDAIELAESLGLDILCADVVEHFVIHNDWNLSSLGRMFFTIDINHIFDDPYSNEDDPAEKIAELKMLTKTRPIAIFVSPYASQRDLVDHIKKTFASEIEPMQKKYQDPNIKIGAVRARSERVRERNKFIRENAHLSSKEIMGLVHEKFGEVLDYTYIAKIIASGKQKKKK